MTANTDRTATISADQHPLKLTPVARIPRLRVLAWDGDVLYASRGYQLLRSRPDEAPLRWEPVASFAPARWRRLTALHRISSRLVRDGFHAIAALPGGNLVAALPGAIATLTHGEAEFRVTHRIARGTRPLNFGVAPNGHIYWGEYFDNQRRDEVHVYGSTDGGLTWQVAHTFPAKSIRHIHNIIYDRDGICFWVLTGDIAEECRILRVSANWDQVETVLAGNQQVRAVAAVPAADGLYFASDTPLEKNYIYHLDRSGEFHQRYEINSSVLCGCAVGKSVFFSTMVEPSAVNRDRQVALYGSRDPASLRTWSRLMSWRKDFWSLKYFQYGNAFLPTGNNTTNLLALTTIAVTHADQVTSIFRLETDG